MAGSPMIESMIRKGKLTMAAKTTTTNNVSFSHYGDGSTTATITRDLSPNATGYSLAMPLKTEGLGPFTTHKMKMTMTTDDEVIGFEPLILSFALKHVRIDSN